MASSLLQTVKTNTARSACWDPAYHLLPDIPGSQKPRRGGLHLGGEEALDLVPLGRRFPLVEGHVCQQLSLTLAPRPLKSSHNSAGKE